MKKILLTLSVLIIWITNFSLGADSYTCSYKWIINGVSNKYWIPNTNYIYNCNDLGGVYDCNVYTNVNVSNWNCYQFSWFDLSSYTDINLSFDLGSTYINFSYNNNNLDMLNGYMVCSPSRIAIQWRITTYNPNPSFIITEIQESLIYNYSETYTCQSSSCDYSEYESQINTLSWNLATCEWMYNRLETDYDLLSWNYNTCVSDLNSCMNNSSCEWDIQWSSLFINDNQVLWNKNIFINIPFEYEYSYTNEWEDFELDVVWLDQDEEYIEWVLSVQNYKPTSEDFTELISTLAPYSKILIFCLFLFILWAWLKKPFKSKKL